MRSITLSIIVLCACGPGKGETDSDSAGSTGSGSTTSTSASTSGSTGPTDPGTSGGPGPITITTITSAGTDEPTSEPASMSEPGTSGVTTGDVTVGPGTTGNDTAGPGECADDGDCKLVSDCCTCQAVPVDEDAVVCDAACEQQVCEQLNITAAVCRLGVCIPERLSCDQSKVQCKAPIPDCPPGTLPETTPDCWTGACVPAQHCDVVPSCEFCGDETVCVQKAGFVIESVSCEPVLPTCDTAAACGCIGDQVCVQPFGFCTDTADHVITCECPNC